MITTEKTEHLENAQSLAEFRESAAATINRINQTGEPEAITVDGEIRAMVVPAAMYAEMANEILLSRDVAVIRRSLQQYRAGHGRDLHAFSRELRARLAALPDVEAENGHP